MYIRADIILIVFYNFDNLYKIVLHYSSAYGIIYLPHFLVFYIRGELYPVPIHTSTQVEVQARYSCVLEYYEKQDCVATV